MSRTRVVPYTGSLALEGVQTNTVTLENMSSIITCSGTYSFEIVGFANTQTNNQFFMSRSSGSDRNTLSVSNGSGSGWSIYFHTYNGSYTAKRIPYKGGWFHAVGVCNNNVLTLYVDGVEATSTLTSYASTAGNSTLYLGFPGSSTNGARATFGNIARFRCWSRALSSEEARLISLDGAPSDVIRDSLAVEWLFTEMSGSVLTDTSGNSRNGTITSGTWSTNVPVDDRNTATGRFLNIPGSTASMRFNGTSTLVDCGTDFLGSGALSGGGWVFPARVGEGSAGRIFDNGSAVLRRYDERFQFSSDGGSTYALSGSRATLNQWYHVFFSRNAAGLTQFYINGEASGSASSSGTPVAATTNLIIGNNSGSGRTWNGNLYKLQFFEREVTPDEVRNIYNNSGPLPSGALAEYYLDQRYTNTSTAYDTSGNGRHASVTAAASPPFDGNLPVGERVVVNNNLVRNGDFSIIPAYSPVMTTTDNRWVNNTESGLSGPTSPYCWGINTGANGAAGAMFDTVNTINGKASVKLSTLTSGGNNYVEFYPFPGGAVLPGLIGRDYLAYLSPLEPNTKYTISCWIKTQYNSGDATTGLQVIFREMSISSSSTATNYLINGSKETTGWTYYQATFTTTATTITGYFRVNLYGHNGAATLLMDAWIADIRLVPTTLETRTNA